jgi:HEAT repeat protein
VIFRKGIPVSRKLLALLAAILALSGVRADEDPKIGDKKVTEWFKFLREEQDARRRQAALMIIDREAGPKVGVVFPGLVKELREHPDPAVRAKIAELMPKYKDRGGDEVANALKAALTNDKEGKVRAAAAAALGQLGRPLGFSAVKELGDALKDKDAGTRAAAAEAIGDFSRIDPEIAKESAPALAAALQDSDTQVRLQSAFALGRMGAAAETAVAALAASLPKEKDIAVRKEITKTLTAMGPSASGATAALVAALKDESPDVRQTAAIALGHVNPDAGLALPELLKATKDRDKSVRCYAIHAIGSLGKSAASAIPDLIEIVRKDEVADVRVAAIEELAGFGNDAKAAVDALTVASKDGRLAIREAALEALKKIQQSP